MKNIFVDDPKFAEYLDKQPIHVRRAVREFVGYGIQLHLICRDTDPTLDYAAYTEWICKFNGGRTEIINLSGGLVVELEEECSPSGTKAFSFATPENDEMAWYALTAEKAKAFRFHGKLYTT